MRLNEPSKPVQATHCVNTASHGNGVIVTPAKPGKLVRLPYVETQTGLKKSTIYAGMRAGTFPLSIRLTARAVAWREEDIDRWISGCVTTEVQS